MTVPYGIGFDVVPSMRCLTGLFVVDCFVDVAFVVDIFLNFCTAFRNPDGMLARSSGAHAKERERAERGR